MRQISIVKKQCSGCMGYGAKGNYPRITCKVCNGKGYIIVPIIQLDKESKDDPRAVPVKEGL